MWIVILFQKPCSGSPSSIWTKYDDGLLRTCETEWSVDQGVSSGSLRMKRITVIYVPRTKSRLPGAYCPLIEES